MKPYWTLAYVLAIMAGCSSSSTESGGVGTVQPEQCIDSTAIRHDENACTKTDVSGLCFRATAKVASASLEYVCAAGPDGAMYLVAVNGDTNLSGKGWTFGPRAYGPGSYQPVYDVEPDTLSDADHVRCTAAQSACGPGAPHDAGVTGDR